MAAITFNCPSCNHENIADDSLCGNTTICKNCDRSIVIPIPGVEAGMDLNGFLLKEKLGAGGMGEVWLAYQAAMDRHVAVKILSPNLTLDHTFVERFQKEIKNSAKLDHPNIVTAFHTGCERGIYYFVISYIKGKGLDERIMNGGPIPEKESLEIVYQVAEALEYAWDEHRILHRDIKPANIMVDKKGIPQLMDMGISKNTNDEAGITMTGMVVGTPYYMSPEQAIADKELDFRADIYSLGATLYHMVTGTVPYDATTAMAIISKHMHDPFPSPKERNPHLSEEVSALLEVMMAKSKEARPASWLAMKHDIERVLEGRMPLTTRPAPGTSTIMRQPVAIADPAVEAAHSTDTAKTIVAGEGDLPDQGSADRDDASTAATIAAAVAAEAPAETPAPVAESPAKPVEPAAPSAAPNDSEAPEAKKKSSLGCVIGIIVALLLVVVIVVVIILAGGLVWFKNSPPSSPSNSNGQSSGSGQTLVIPPDVSVPTTGQLSADTGVDSGQPDVLTTTPDTPAVTPPTIQLPTVDQGTPTQPDTNDGDRERPNW